MSGELFTEKYRPQTLDEIGGYKKNIEQIIEWGNRFCDEIPTSNKGLIIHGSEGIGKTSIAKSMAKDYGWEVIEMNASDSRTYNDIIDTLMIHATSQDINNPKGRQLLLIEECDNLYSNAGRRDLTGEKAILELLIKTQNPIIMTCNDIFNVSFNIKKLCTEVKMDKIRSTSIIKILKTIASKEKVKIPTEIFEQLVSDGDVRSSINNLQIYMISGLIADGKKESEISPFALIDTIFKTDDPFSLEGIIEKSGMNPEEALLWIEENVKYRYKGLERVYAYKALEKADIYLKKARQTGDYNLYWKLAVREMTINVAVARRFPPQKGWIQTVRPIYFKKMSATKQVRNVMKSIGNKMVGHNLLHSSRRTFINEDFPLLQRKCITDIDFLTKISSICNFTDQEIAMFLDSDLYDPRIKKVLNAKYVATSEMVERIDRQDQNCKALDSFF